MGLRSSFYIAAFFFAVFLIPQVSFAQDAAGVSIQPGLIEQGADPGDVIEEQITVKNISTTERTYYFLKRDISGVGANGIPIFAEEGAEITGYEISEWVTLPVEPLTLAPDESASIPVTISVPENATPGSHFGGVFVTLDPPRLRELGAGVGFDVGAIVSIRISGDVVETARIREFSTDKLIYSEPDVDFLVRIENPGNVLIRPRGPLEINNMFGRRVGLITVNDTLAGVFPGSIRTFNVEWDEEGVGLGRYQAIVGMLYGEAGAQQTVSATVSFWILPAKIIFPVLGGLALFALTIYIGVKVHVRRTINRMTTTGGVRRVAVQRRRDAGISRLAVVLVTLLAVTTLFLIALLVLFA